MVIFCWTHVDTNTSAGMTTVNGSGWPRSSQRNSAFSGAAEWMLTTGIQLYSLSESPTRSSGLENTVWINTRNSPIRMGICTTSGPRQPMGLTPASRYMRMVSCDTRARSLR